MTKKRKRKGPKRHIRKSLIVAIVVIVVGIVAIIKVPGMITDSKLRSLGYQEAEVKEIRKEKLDSLILKNQYYSEYLAQCISDHSLRKDYISLYTKVNSTRGLTDDDLLLYNRLEDLGYEEDQLENLYENLTFREILPLLLFDYQWDENQYIEDCKNNRSKNSGSSFTLDGDYLTEFKNITTIDTIDGPFLINTRNAIASTYAPDDLTTISTEYAASDQELTSQASTQFLAMAKAALTSGNPFFATETYISYEDQLARYNNLVSQVGQNLADIYTERAGFSEHQTGLAVNIAATYDDNENITTTGVYQWLTENCIKYGFILRYPPTYTTITDQADEETHLLYLGKDLATKVQESHLTYDEYYQLYLAHWYDEKYVPDASLLASTNCTDTLQQKEPESTSIATSE